MTEKKFIVVPEFRDKIPPLTADEFKRLEENIVADGEVREPLIVWNNTLIDGHHRWQIIQKHPEIPYKVKEMDFADKWAAISWMCSNQLGRRNVDEFTRADLIKTMYEARQKSYGGDRKSEEFSSGQNDLLISPTRNRTRAELAKELNTSEQEIRFAVEFGRGLDKGTEVDADFRKDVLSGKVKATKGEIQSLRKLGGEELKQAVEELKKPKAERKPKAKQNYADGDTRKTYQLIRELSEDAGNIEKESVYGIDNAVGDLTACKDSFLQQIGFVMNSRASTINESAETRAKVAKFIDSVIIELNKIKEEMK